MMILSGFIFSDSDRQSRLRQEMFLWVDDQLAFDLDHCVLDLADQSTCMIGQLHKRCKFDGDLTHNIYVDIYVISRRNVGGPRISSSQASVQDLADSSYRCFLC
jgi:hypothetical protein